MAEIAILDDRISALKTTVRADKSDEAAQAELDALIAERKELRAKKRQDRSQAGWHGGLAWFNDLIGREDE